MKLVYRNFEELYATIRGKTVEIKPKEFVPKKAEPKEKPKAEAKEEPKEEPKPKKSRKKKEEK